MANQSDVLAGKAVVEVSLKAENMQKFFNEWGKRASAFGQRMNAAGRKLAIQSIVLSVPAIAGLREFGRFSKEMAFVSTMLDNTRKHMGRFSDEVLKMSVKFGQSTAALSKGLFDILSGGFLASKGIDFLTVASRSAVAGMTDVATSTKALVAILNSYGLSATFAADVSDTLFQTVRFGVLTFEELSQGIGLVSASAAAAGVSMDELGASIAVITRAGVHSSATFVAFNNILKAFIAPTGAGADFAKKLKEAGFAFDISIQGIRKSGFANIMKELSRLPLESLAKLFPSIRALRGMAAIKALSEGLKSLPETLKKFNNKAGATDRAFKKMSGSFGFLLQQFKAAGKLILVHFGEAVAGNLKGIGKRIVFIADAAGKWLKSNKGLIAGYIKMIGVIGAVSLALLTVAKVMATVSTISAFMSGLMTASMINVAIAIAAATVAGVAMAKMLSDISRAIKDIQTASLLTETSEEANTGSKSRLESIQGEINAIRKKNEAIAETLERIKEETKEVEKRTNVVMFAGKLVKRRGRRADEARAELRNLKIARSMQTVALRDNEKELKFLRNKSKMVQEALNAEKQLRNAEADRIASISTATRGGFAGFFRTQQLLFSSTAKSETKSEDLLGQIQSNTRSSADQLETFTRDGIKILATN